MYAVSLNITVSRALPGLHSTVDALWFLLPGWRVLWLTKNLPSSAHKSSPGFWSDVAGNSQTSAGFTREAWQPVDDWCLCFCSGTHSSWDTGKSPAGCLHPSQGGVFLDAPPLSNFTQREHRCADVQNSSPSGCGGLPVGPGALRYPEFDWEGPGRGRSLAAAAAGCLGCSHPVHPCSAISKTACAGGRPAGNAPRHYPLRLRQPHEPLLLKGRGFAVY